MGWLAALSQGPAVSPRRLVCRLNHPAARHVAWMRCRLSWEMFRVDTGDKVPWRLGKRPPDVIPLLGHGTLMRDLGFRRSWRQRQPAATQLTPLFGIILMTNLTTAC